MACGSSHAPPSSPGLVGGGKGKEKSATFFPFAALCFPSCTWGNKFFEFFCNTTCHLHLPPPLPPTQILEFSSLPFPFLSNRLSLSLLLWLSVIVACKGGTFSLPLLLLEQCWVDSTPAACRTTTTTITAAILFSLSSHEERRRREGRGQKDFKFSLFSVFRSYL